MRTEDRAGERRIFPDNGPNKPPGGWSDIGMKDGDAEAAMPADLRDGPFILFDDARGGKPGRLYKNPIEIIEVWRLEEIDDALEMIDRRVREGAHAAGYVSYEAGYAFEPRLARLLPLGQTDQPLLWFGLFDRPFLLKTQNLPDHPQPESLSVESKLSGDSYRSAIGKILDYIYSGDCYQVNLTFSSEVGNISNPIETYQSLRQRQAGGWGGFLSTGERQLLSCSPELYFTIKDDRMAAKPMKGTAPRGRTPELDRQCYQQLSDSQKDRAENLMIVDLLRNDISRIAIPSSVIVPKLFEIEEYPTIFQMTSTIEAQVRSGLTAVDVLRATFPCGSITGAPKVRAMEIINEVEHGHRGAYTGSMGFITPDGTAAFNVLIRTLELEARATMARIGLGSAIVANSDADLEWAECAAKAAFLRPF